MDVKFQPAENDFFKRLRTDVNLYFKEKNIKPTGGSKIWWKTIVIGGALAGIYLWLVAFSPYSWWLCIGLYAVLGVIIALIGFNLMHDGAHGSFSDNKFVNQMMAYSLNMLGGNSQLWTQKHNINHHTYTNIETHDDDLNLDPFMRLHDQQKKKWFHRYQHLYALILYGTTYLIWIYFLDFKKYFSGKIGDSPIPKLTVKEHFIFWLSKIFHLAIFVLVPVFALGAAKAIVGYLIASVVTGLIISVVFQLAHIVEGVGFASPQPSATQIDIKSEWAIHQVNTTANFATDNKLITWLVGGLNYQMIHHLFPKISHVHYPAIRPIVLATCKAYNLEYVEYPHMRSAILSHLRHLKKIGRS